MGYTEPCVVRPLSTLGGREGGREGGRQGGRERGREGGEAGRELRDGA